MIEPDELERLSPEELRQYNAVLKSQIDKIEARLAEMKLTAENTIKNAELEPAPVTVPR